MDFVLLFSLILVMDVYIYDNINMSSNDFLSIFFSEFGILCDWCGVSVYVCVCVLRVGVVLNVYLFIPSPNSFI